MRCRDALRLSTAYVDGELERASVARRPRPPPHLSDLRRRGRRRGPAATRRGRARADRAPPSLWQQIQGQLAVDEIAEAGRSPIGLGLLCALDRLRRHALSATVAVTAAVLAVVWLSGPTRTAPLLYRILPAPRVAAAPMPSSPGSASPGSASGGSASGGSASGGSASGGSASGGSASGGSASGGSVEEAMASELVAALAHHEDVVAELTLAVAELRPTWSEPERRRFDRDLAAASARIARARLGMAGGGEDLEVLAAYRSEIALLTRAVSGGLGALAVVGPGEAGVTGRSSRRAGGAE